MTCIAGYQNRSMTGVLMLCQSTLSLHAYSVIVSCCFRVPTAFLALTNSPSLHYFAFTQEVRHIMHVPSEILHLIFAGLPKRDLKSSRLVCRKWDAQVPPLLFNTVFFIARYADLEMAELVMEKYGRFIGTLVYSAEHLEHNIATRKTTS